MELHFRHVSAEDPQLLSLTGQLDCYFREKYGSLTLQYVKHHDLSSLDCRMLALLGEAAAGCGGWRRMDGETAEIKRIFVLPEHRRKGIAWTLLRVLENDAARQGCTRAVLATGAEGYGALAFYQSCGYHFCEGFGDFAGDPVCACMEKLF